MMNMVQAVYIIYMGSVFRHIFIKKILVCENSFAPGSKFQK